MGLREYLNLIQLPRVITVALQLYLGYSFNMKNAVVYDLDETIIDSKHRTPNKPDGSLDLETYFKRRHLLPRDTLLPLVNVMRKNFINGCHVVICTSRSMDDLDYTYLDRNKIPFHHILKREWGCKDDDAELKKHLLLDYFDGRVKGIPVYDDNLHVLKMVKSLGMIPINSIIANRMLAHGDC